MAILASAAFLTAACSGSNTPGSPSPASQPPSSSAPPVSRTPPYAGAPKVASPLPSMVLSGSACDALTPDQVKINLGKTVAGKPDHLPGIGAECNWTNSQTGGQMAVFYVTEPKTGLSGDYANTRPQMAVWKELPPIQGFPAVAYSDNGKPNPGYCAVSVGITDTLSVDVHVNLSDDKAGKVDACTVVPLTADDVVTTLKQKAGS
ncbi:DUF3558 family protein [Amycolatopsis sp. PS_44_ISF1]|uniref:DUF3558 family protein n=1 Tax=Amycolatopsis sp. PS_44_ISF1 TaxID=2974917 RepID=UPI0028DE29E8|nr:DUF3558 family protein [Amycolatopsis sp. PS_44_ISF1]MDT8910264.1 DUF3558 domain-containing protein [Amycolatopsis sp. PS_44_ISF1]